VSTYLSVESDSYVSASKYYNISKLPIGLGMLPSEGATDITGFQSNDYVSEIDGDVTERKGSWWPGPRSDKDAVSMDTHR
jgi:hypothetical protein